MPLPCPKCGKTPNGTFCNDCRTELHPLVTKMKPGKMMFCADCDKVNIQGSWKSITRDKAIRMALGQALTFSDEASIEGVAYGEVEILKNPGIKRVTEVETIVTGREGDAETSYDETYATPLSYEVRLCGMCKKGGSYYEGALQLRNTHADAEAFIDAYLQEHRKKGITLAKTVPAKKGADYYLSSHRAVGHLAKKLHQEFGGEIKINAQHFSESKQEGRILYRTNALIELPEYRKGQVIKYNDKYYYVIGIGHNVKAENIVTGTNETFPYHHGDATPVQTKEAEVASTDPLEVTHPVTYAQVTPLLSKFAPAELEVGNKVNVGVDGDTLILIP